MQSRSNFHLLNPHKGHEGQKCLFKSPKHTGRSQVAHSQSHGKVTSDSKGSTQDGNKIPPKIARKMATKVSPKTANKVAPKVTRGSRDSKSDT